jgi:sulfoxide reductase heme-binding subunit YedZ
LGANNVARGKALAGDRHPYRARRILRQFRIGLATSLIGTTVYLRLRPADPLFLLSMATGYAGFAMLALSLLLGPWKVLRGRHSPVSTELRRDVGIWAAILSVAHVYFGLQVHLRGHMWEYFFAPPGGPRGDLPRVDLFGFANYTGLAITLVLTVLLAISNDRALRRLGTRRWKALQRWNYAAFVLVILHAAAYQIIERRELLLVAVLGAIAMVVVASQLAGIRRVRKSSRQDSQGDRGPRRFPDSPRW